MNVLLKYNPYRLETVITVEGKEIKGATWSKYLNERIQVWVEELFDLMEEQLNTRRFDLTFHGTLLDYEDILEQVEIYNTQKGFDITLNFQEASTTHDKVTALSTLFDDIQKGPFDDLRDDVLRKNFETALGDEFEVSVIATMSSGKSTLINAFLGKELMPSKNEACTATVSRIKDINGQKHFTGTCKDADGKVIGYNDNLTKATMEEWNREEVRTIEIEGEIPAINSQNIKLVLVDTPGPNNSRNSEHKAHTFRLIRNASKPMVMYILNGTQLQTNDDHALLSAVADEMRVNGKQSKDRFLFVVNKMDQFDSENNDDISETLDNVRQYLEKHGIENPNIYPASAELAKVIRICQREGEEVLTRRQRKTLRDEDLFRSDERYHFTNYASLTPRLKRKLQEQIEDFKDQEDYLNETLIHSGIPAIEEAINEYLEKYAYTAKLKNAVDTFKKKIEEKNLMNKITELLESSKEEREHIGTQMREVQHIINEGEEAKKFRQKVNNINLDVSKSKEMRQLVKKVEAELSSFGNAYDKKVEAYEADTIVRRVTNSIENLSLDVQEEIINVINHNVNNQATQYIEEYRRYVSSLLALDLLNEEDYASNHTLSLFEADIPTANELINRYRYTEQVKVGEKWVENTSKKWWKPWTWGQSKGHYKAIYEDREYVDAKNIIEELLTPARMNFEENYEATYNYAKKEAENLKAYFISEMDKIDQVIKQKANELARLAGDEVYLEKQIQENMSKKQWLDGIIERLNTILDI